MSEINITFPNIDFDSVTIIEDGVIDLSSIAMVENEIMELADIITYTGYILDYGNADSKPRCLDQFQRIFISSSDSSKNIRFTQHIIKLGKIIRYINLYDISYSKKKKKNDTAIIQRYRVNYNYHLNFICQRLYCNIDDIIDIDATMKVVYKVLWNMPVYSKNGNRKIHSRVRNSIKPIEKQSNGKIHVNYDGIKVQNMPISIQFSKSFNIVPYFGFDEAQDCLTCLISYIESKSILCCVLNAESKRTGCVYTKIPSAECDVFEEYCFFLKIHLPFGLNGIEINSYDTKIIHALCKVPYHPRHLHSALILNDNWEHYLIHLYKQYQEKVEKTINIYINKKFNDLSYEFVEIICTNTRCKASQVIKRWDKISDIKYTCTKCYNSDMCRSCCKGYHEGICDFTVDRDSNEWIITNTKPCPVCKINIEKNGGCNHMTCSRCNPKTHFCWKCNVIYTVDEINNHYNNANPFEQCIVNV